MNNIKKGNIWCAVASGTALLSIFCWFGRAFRLTYADRYGDRYTESIKVFDLITESSVLSIMTFCLIGGFIVSLIALYKSISGILNNKNNCLLSTTLLSTNILSIVYFFILKESCQDNYYYDDDYEDFISIKMATNLFVLLVMLATAIITAIVGTINSYKKDKSNEPAVSKKITDLTNLLNSGTITQEEYAELRKNLLNNL